jgi:hypothetical protein
MSEEESQELGFALSTWGEQGENISPSFGLVTQLRAKDLCLRPDTGKALPG